MLPVLFGLRTYYLSWLAAAVCAMWIGLRSTRTAGLPPRRAFVLLLLCSITVLLGAKLLYLAEYQFFPNDDGMRLPQTTLYALAWHGFRIPGGVVLLAAVLPGLCSGLRLPTRRTADAIMPALGIAICFVRLGCFLNGCCFGRVSHWPWAARCRSWGKQCWESHP